MHYHLLGKFTYLFIASIFIAVFYNIPSLISKINTVYDGELSFSVLRYSFCELLLVFLVLFSLFSVLAFSIILLKFFILILIITSSIISFYIFNESIFVEENLIGALFETNMSEAVGVFNIYIIPWFCVTALLPIYFLIFVYSYRKKPKRSYFIKYIYKYLVTMLIGLITIFVLYSSLFSGRYVLKNSLSYYLPLNYISALYLYFAHQYNSNIFLKDINTLYKFSNSNDNVKKNIILIIGESARADHQSLNGYNRDTNPLLAKQPNLYSFKNVESCGTLSRISVNCILSYETMQEFQYPMRYNNIISVFNNLGYDTYFLSSQTMYDSNYNSFAIASQDAHVKIFINNLREYIKANSEIYDDYLLRYMDKNLSYDNNKNRFIVMYLTGSHFPYNKRYPKEFRKFTPDNDNTKEGKINSYDNTILYTDHILNEIIKRFANTNTLVYYVADHGESLGEKGVYKHGANRLKAPKEQINVAQFIWVSEAMKKYLGKKVNNIKAKVHNPLNQDNVFHSLLDCFDVKSSAIDMKLSLCN